MRNYSAADDGRRYRDDEMVGKLAGFQLPGMDAWQGVTDGRQKADETLHSVRFGMLHGAGVPTAEVATLMPIELDWLDAGGPPIRTIPVGRP